MPRSRNGACPTPPTAPSPGISPISSATSRPPTPCSSTAARSTRKALRTRIQHQIGTWQNSHPHVLENPEPDLAVARGAAKFGGILHHRSARIQAGAARSIYLEVHQAGKEKPSLVCILPRGAEPEVEFRITPPGLELRLNRPSASRPAIPPATTRTRPAPSSPRNPAISTNSRLSKPPPASPKNPAAADRLPVHLTAKLTELGLLHLECVSADPAIDQAWPLAFNLRADDTPVLAETDPGSRGNPRRRQTTHRLPIQRPPRSRRSPHRRPPPQEPRNHPRFP